MVWWGVVIVALLSMAIGALAVFVVMRRKIIGAQAAAELAQIQKAVADDTAATEKLAKDEIEKSRLELAERLSAVNTWYNDHKLRIGRNAKKNYEALAGDPDALDRELKRLLSRG